MTPAPPNKKAALRGGRVAGPGEQLLAELRPGQSIELLKELHILTREGQLNQDSRRKLKQVYHLFHFIEKILADLTAQRVGAATAGGQCIRLGPCPRDHGRGNLGLAGSIRLVVADYGVHPFESHAAEVPIP